MSISWLMDATHEEKREREREREREKNDELRCYEPPYGVDGLLAGWHRGPGLPRRPGMGSRSLGTEQGEAWGTGTDLDVERQLWAQWEVAGDGWQAGDGNMEG
ncbi:Transcription initiation factor TFIID subunit 3, partial [Clarias magur]